MLKKVWRKIINSLDIKRHIDFNFEQYIINEFGFKLLSENKHEKVYGTGDFYLIITDENEVLINSVNNNRLLCKINFIPKGSLFVDLMINQVISSNNGR